MARCLLGASLYGAATLDMRGTALINNSLAPFLQARARREGGGGRGFGG